MAFQSAMNNSNRNRNQSQKPRSGSNFLGYALSIPKALHNFLNGNSPNFLSNLPAGKMEDVTKESNDFAQLQGTLFQGVQFNTDITPSSALKFMTNIRAGTPGRDASVSVNAICFSNNYFVQAQWDGMSTAVARTRIRARPFDIAMTARAGSDYSKNFIAEFGLDYIGKNCTCEFQYEGAHENMINISYTQRIFDQLVSGVGLVHSLKQKSSIMQFASRLDLFEKLAFYGSMVLPQIPNTNIIIPNRLAVGFSGMTMSNTHLEKISAEFQINPSEEQAFDTLLVLFYDLRRLKSSYKCAIDSSYRIFALFEQSDPVQRFGTITLSTYIDPTKKDVKFGVGFTVNQ